MGTEAPTDLQQWRGYVCLVCVKTFSLHNCYKVQYLPKIWTQDGNFADLNTFLGSLARLHKPNNRVLVCIISVKGEWY